MSKKNIPLRIPKSEEVISFLYSILTYIAMVLLVVSTLHISIVYICALLFKTQYNEQLAQLGIYIVVGTFLFIFVYDEKCKRKLHELKEYECPKCGKLNFDEK